MIPIELTNAASGTLTQTEISLVGVAIAVRRLGKVTFLVVRDASSEMQVVVTGDLQQQLGSHQPPFYLTVTGALGARPDKDRRDQSLNGSVELVARSVRVHRPGGRPAGHPLDELVALTTRLQGLGFVDANTLASAFAPRYRALLASDDAIGAARHLAELLGPCRWYFATPQELHFGQSPGGAAALRAIFAADTDRNILDHARWHDENARGNAPHVPMACATLPLRSAGEEMEEGPYWCNRYAITDLDGDLLATAADCPKLDGAGVRALEEGIVRSDALLRIIAGAGAGRDEAGGVAIVLRDLTEFDLHATHMKEIFALFPSLEKRLSHLSGEQQFELLWSILGHDHVKAVFSSPESSALLSRCVGAGMFGDYNALRHLAPETLAAIATLTRDFADDAATAFIDRMFGASSSTAASACHLMRDLHEAGLDWRRSAAVARRGIASRLAFMATADGVDAAEIAGWRDALAIGLRHLFTNAPVDEDACHAAFAATAAQFSWASRMLERCPSDARIFDLIQLTFGNGLVSYEESARMYAAAEDCSTHWAAANVDFGGARWNAPEARFDLTRFWLYPSKNKAAILAKSCSGICSARNVSLFHRPDHFQFTLVDPGLMIAAGSVQMYAHRDAHGRDIWVVRGLNPSEKAVVEPIGFTFEILDTLASLAKRSGIEALVCADGAGLFAADSSRLALRAILRRAAATRQRVDFQNPLHIFDYHDRAISIDHGWQVWPQ